MSENFLFITKITKTMSKFFFFFNDRKKITQCLHFFLFMYCRKKMIPLFIEKTILFEYEH